MIEDVLKAQVGFNQGGYQAEGTNIYAASRWGTSTGTPRPPRLMGKDICVLALEWAGLLGSCAGRSSRIDTRSSTLLSRRCMCGLTMSGSQLLER